MTAEEAGKETPDRRPPASAAFGGILVLVAFPSLPLLVSGTGQPETSRRIAAAGWLGAPLWLLPIAAVLLMVLGALRVTSRTRAATILVGAAGLGVFGLILDIKLLQGSPNSLYGNGIDPTGGIGAGYWVSLAGLVVAFLGGMRELMAARGSGLRAVPVVAGATAGIVLGTLISAAVLGARQNTIHRGVVLLAVNTIGEGAVGPDFAVEPASVTPDPDLSGDVAGNSERLYFDRFGKPSCDRDRILALVGDQVPGADLTPVRLRADIRVTAHRFDGDRITPYQAVLQAGTPVLVDRHGIPRVRCTGAIPLTPPQYRPRPNYLRPPWPGFDKDNLVTVTPAPDDIRQFGLTDHDQEFRRPVGGNGKNDVARDPSAATLDGTYTLSGKLTDCSLKDCTKDGTVTLSITVAGCPDRCHVSSRRWSTEVNLAETSGTWNATGNTAESFYCGEKPIPTGFGVSLRVTAGTVVDTRWTAKQFQGVYTETSPATDSCRAGTLTWEINGSRA
jgi:hypothetical protein